MAYARLTIGLAKVSGANVSGKGRAASALKKYGGAAGSAEGDSSTTGGAAGWVERDSSTVRGGPQPLAIRPRPSAKMLVMPVQAPMFVLNEITS